MANDREYDQDTVGDYDENTLSGSEGLDADTLYTDGEDLTVDPPEEWKPIEEHDTLDEKLEAERPDVDAAGGPVPSAEPGAEPAERRDAIDGLNPEDETRVLGDT